MCHGGGAGLEAVLFSSLSFAQPSTYLSMSMLCLESKKHFWYQSGGRPSSPVEVLILFSSVSNLLRRYIF